LKVTELSENEDLSVTLEVEMTEEEAALLIEYAFDQLLIKKAKEYYEDMECKGRK
jgi:hypothetical protein